MCDKLNSVENNNNNNGNEYESGLLATSSDNRISFIVEELNSIFQERLTDIDCRKGIGDCNELKSLTYKEWNDMLMDMIKNMIDAFTDLEVEATRRISLLERKLNFDKTHNSDLTLSIKSSSSAENNNIDPEKEDQKMTISHLKTDIDSLLEVIRRAVDDNNWSTGGLQFYSIIKDDIFNKIGMPDDDIWTDKIEKIKSLNSKLLCALQDVKRLDSEKHVLKTEICRKDVLIAQLEAKIVKLEREDKPCPICDMNKKSDVTDNSTATEDDNFKKSINELTSGLVEKEVQLANKIKENESLLNEIKHLRTNITDKEKVIISMKSLAFEVADKHDQLQQIKSQLFAMEEELQQAHKKIKLKDNVIKDLRKDCKNNLKFNSCQDTCSTDRSLQTYQSTYKSIDNSSFSHFYTAELNEQRRIMNFKENLETNKNCEQIGDINMNDMEIEFEKSKERSYSAEEACYMKILGIELEDLLESQKDFNSEQYKQFNLIHKNIKDKCSKMIHDLVISNAKLTYVRKQLMMIADFEITNGCGDSDPGYMSLEEKEPEESMISTVCDKISNLQNENKCLRNEISKLQLDVQSATSNVSQKMVIIEKNGKLLKDVASCLSSICGKNISLENLLLDDLSLLSSDCHRKRSGADSNCCITKLNNPLCAAIMDLEKEIIQRNNRIDEMQKITFAMEKELNCSNTKISILESETSYKEKTITELQDKNNYQKQSIQKLESEKNNCIEKLRQYTESELQTKYTDLLTVHQNLQQELAFEVLLEQLGNHFNENYQMEKMIWTIRDENLAIKERLIDSETEYRCLQNHYHNIVAQERNYQQNLTQSSLQQYKSTFLQYPLLPSENFPSHRISSSSSSLSKQLPIITIKQQEYRDILDDLTNEITNLTNQVTMAQIVIDTDKLSSPLEKGLRQLEIQNDLLQKTIENLETKNLQYEFTLKNNEIQEQELQCQITSLEGINQQQDNKYKELCQKYQSLLDTLQRFKARCKCGESRFIEFDENDISVLEGRKGKELPHIFDLLERKTEELKRINEQSSNERTRLTKKIFDLEEDRNKLQIKIAVLDSSLGKKENELRQCQKGNDVNSKSVIEKLTRELNDERIQHKNRELQLECDLKTMRKCMDVEKGAIIKTSDTLVHLEKQIGVYREKLDTVNKENAIYKAELYTLKGNLATFEGTERSLKEQLTKTQEELYNIRCNFQKTNSFNEEIENLKKNCGSLKESNYKLIRQYNDLIEDYNRLLEEYRKLLDIKEEMTKELEVHRKWQNEATTQENLVEEKINKMEDHITCLMEDREILINKLNELHRDSILLSSELERYKDCFNDTLSEAQYRTDPTSGDYSDSVTSKILRTATKLSHARAIWSERERRYSK